MRTYTTIIFVQCLPLALAWVVGVPRDIALDDASVLREGDLEVLGHHLEMEVPDVELAHVLAGARRIGAAADGVARASRVAPLGL